MELGQVVFPESAIFSEVARSRVVVSSERVLLTLCELVDLVTAMLASLVLRVEVNGLHAVVANLLLWLLLLLLLMTDLFRLLVLWELIVLTLRLLRHIPVYFLVRP